MNIFGKEIQIKENGCNNVDFVGSKIPPSVNIFVKVTNGCNCHCQFCSNAKSNYSFTNFNLPKLLRIVQETQIKEIGINRINITGGEPSIVSNLIQEILEEFNKDNLKNIHIHLNTNGLLPQSQMLMKNQRWNSISISLHHYDNKKLKEIYGIEVSEKLLSFENIDKNKINVSCNLIKGYIDSTTEIHKMLDFTLELNIPRIGFVSLMKINDFCKNHYVDFDDIAFETIPNVYFTNSLNRGRDCKCSNYLYNKDARILEIYNRNYVNQAYCESALLFDGQYLRQGFHNENIIY
jgi:molybdenum cofactor biosynthesis enzyme MoaA